MLPLCSRGVVCYAGDNSQDDPNAWQCTPVSKRVAYKQATFMHSSALTRGDSLSEVLSKILYSDTVTFHSADSAYEAI